MRRLSFFFFHILDTLSYIYLEANRFTFSFDDTIRSFIDLVDKFYDRRRRDVMHLMTKYGPRL
jgi:predicted ATPase